MARSGMAKCLAEFYTRFGRAALVPSLLLMLTTSCLDPNALEPKSGLYEYREPLLVEVPGGWVDAAGGNLIVRRVDFSIDSFFGTIHVGAVYNSSQRRWVWPFDAQYDGDTFTDSSGAVHNVSELADGQAIPGTHWRKLDGTRISTKGGLVHHFQPSSHRLDRITWGDQPEPALVFVRESDPLGFRTVEVDQCLDGSCLAVYSIEYDAGACVSRISDRAGRQALFSSDASCNPITAQDPLDVLNGWPGRRYEYQSGQLTAATNSEGERIEYSYLGDHLMAVHVPQSPDSITAFSYGFSASHGLYSTHVLDARSGSRQFYYDSEGRLHTQSDAVGDTTRLAWAGLRPVEIEEPSGALTRWEYSDDDPVRVIWPGGNVLEFEYEPGGLNRNFPDASARSSVRDSVGLIERNVYDGLGRKVLSFNGAEELTTFSYSETGQLVVVVKPDGQATWFFEYGEHGHAQLVERTGEWAVRRRFDAVGNLLASPDFQGPVDPGRPGIVNRSFDADRNLIRLELVGGTDEEPLVDHTSELEIEYRSDGRPLRIFRPYGGDTRFDYDGAGQLVARSERVDGVWETVHYEYSAGGLLSATEWPNSMRHEVDRDPAGRPLALRLMRNGVTEKSVVSTWTSGRLVAREDSRRPGPETIFYDEAGEISGIHFPEGEYLEFARDLRGREVWRAYRMGVGAEPIRTLARSYDGAGRLVEWRDGEELILERTYESGRLVEEVSGNGIVRNFLYGDEGFLTDAITSSLHNFYPYLSTTYEWEACGSLHYCITAASMGEAGPDSSVPFVGGKESYRLGPISLADDGFDHAGARLRSWGRTSLPNDNYMGEGEYGFDALGNWLGVWLGEEEKARFIYNGERNRLLSSNVEDQHSYTWDAAGFMSSRDGFSIKWDAGGRPTVLGPDHEMQWDSLGRLISVRAGQQVGRTLFGGLVQGDENRNPVSMDLLAAKIDLTTGKRTYRHVDQRGNVQFVTDHDGVMSRYYLYSPFGVFESGGDGTDRRNFAMGQSVGDYVWLGDRVYDPETGRFLSPDPQYQLINQFAYTLGNPVFFWDPDGNHSVASSLVKAAEMMNDLADRLETLGYTAFAAGLAISSAPIAAAGLAVLASSLAIKWGLKYGCNCLPRVGIEDLPDGYKPDDGGGESSSHGTGPGVDISSCSPQVLTEERRQVHVGWLWLPIQMLLAAGLLRSRKRRNRQPAS